MRRFVFEVVEGIRIAGQAIWANKLRSVLTTLGIVIGIASVTGMATVINGIEAGFQQSLSSLGSNVLYVQVWPAGRPDKWWKYVNRPEIDPSLADAIDRRSRYATATMAEVDEGYTVSRRDRSLEDVQVNGVGVQYPRIQSVDLQRGRFFSRDEARSARSVVVLGATVADELFPIGSPLGREIRVGGREFDVVGVLEKQGGGLFGNGLDGEVLIPFQAFEAQWGVRDRNVEVSVKIDPSASVAEGKTEIIGITRVERGLKPAEENNFEVIQRSDVQESFAPVKTGIYGVGIFLTALALVVGGIGVMNIMFVSVKERTQEIGIRKAVGAKKRTILLQFLIESIIICFIGGVIGVGLSAGIAALVRSTLGVAASLPLSTVALAFGICTAVGVGFGLAPAWTGAQAEPVEALRYE
ncbi:MAG: ABC transporter ATP-binding protein [Bacteroidetes bacterium QH_2_63_10]|nr:MAG: ABC transporter ATP-binding protein [Bacteroidetes bacterium QH_2_63_10]